MQDNAKADNCRNEEYLSKAFDIMMLRKWGVRFCDVDRLWWIDPYSREREGIAFNRWACENAHEDPVKLLIKADEFCKWLRGEK